MVGYLDYSVSTSIFDYPISATQDRIGIQITKNANRQRCAVKWRSNHFRRFSF